MGRTFDCFDAGFFVELTIVCSGVFYDGVFPVHHSREVEVKVGRTDAELLPTSSLVVEMRCM